MGTQAIWASKIWGILHTISSDLSTFHYLHATGTCTCTCTCTCGCAYHAPYFYAYTPSRLPLSLLDAATVIYIAAVRENASFCKFIKKTICVGPTSLTRQSPLDNGNRYIVTVELRGYISDVSILYLLQRYI